MKFMSILLAVLFAFAMGCASAGRLVTDDGISIYGKGGAADAAKKEFIDGTVQDAVTKKGVPGAIVEIKNANLGVGYYRLTTDSKGRFRIDDFIRSINYLIEVTAPGYVTYKSTQVINPGSYAIVLEREGILGGTVRDSAGSPVADAEVRLHLGYYGSGRPLIVKTGTDGAYRFEKLTASTYTASFEKTGYIRETAQIKYIKSGETFSLPMQLFRPASIKGTISIAGLDTAANNIGLTLKGRFAQSTVSFQDGSYAIDDIRPGRYTLTLSHRGFHPIALRDVRVIEGENSIRNFTVQPKDPVVAVSSYRYTFAPGTLVNFNMRTLRVEKVRARLYRVPLETLVNGRIDPNKHTASAMGLKKISEWDEPIQNFEPYEWRYQQIDIKKSLPTGGYCIEISGPGGLSDRKFFSVTAVGIVVKRSMGSVFAYVTSLITNKPIPDARIFVYDNTPVNPKYRPLHHTYKPAERIENLPVTMVHSGATDADGVFHRREKSSRHLAVLAVTGDGSFAFCNTGHPYLFKGELNKFFIYSDRPVYRAGDTVQYKIIGKKRGARFTPIAGKRFYFKVVNRDFNETLDQGFFGLDSWGTASRRIAIAANGHLGEHEIQVGDSPRELYSRGRFYVEQYRKPEFKIDLNPSRGYYINGDTAEVKVEAKYFFGAPLRGALVSYRFYESKLRDTDTTYWWEDEGGGAGSYYRIKLEGEKYVDDNGVAVLRLNCGNYPYDREITVETTITDKSNVSITSKKSFRVGRGDYYIKINPKRHFFGDAEKKIVELTSTTHDGTAVSAELSVRLYRYIWKPWQRVYVHDRLPVYEKRCTTDRNGRYLLELPRKFDRFGEFDIVVEGKDRRDNLITASRVVWIYDQRGAKIVSRFKNLELAVNRTTLVKEGTVTCLLKSRFTDAHVCITLEGRDIYASKVVKMTGNVMPVTIAIKGSYAPNVFVTATMQRNRALFTVYKEITLPNADTGLSIAMKTDKQKYLPGEKATVDFAVTDRKGNPCMADLSLAAVDEAIYSIRHDHTPKMAGFFYSKISNWVLTSYSYPITILAGAAKEDKVKVREKFEDTAFWRANIRTGADGAARVSFTLPDNLTTWRLTSRGHDRSGRMGENTGSLLVTQDLIVRLGKPRYVTEGDKISLIGIINSNTDRGLADVKTSCAIDSKPVKAVPDIKISLPAFGSVRSLYSTQVPENAKSIEVYFEAKADRGARDAIRIKIPVQSRGFLYKLFGIGDMSKNRTVSLDPIVESDDFAFKPSAIELSVNPGPIIKMVKATEFLAKYPYGCIEQMLNRFMPALTLKDLLGRKGLSHLVKGKEIDEKVRVGIDRIAREQNEDGTWGWWSGDRGNEYVTGYVIESLLRAEQLGYTVDKARFVKARDALHRLLANDSGIDDDARAYILYVYTRLGGWSEPAYERLAKQKNLNAYQLAFLVRALSHSRANASQPAAAREQMTKQRTAYVAALKQMQKKDSRGVYWKAEPNQRFGWQGGNTELSAHVLSALIDAGDTSKIGSQLLRSITRRGRGEAWNSTKETATVFTALCSFIDKMGGTISGSGAIDFALNGKPLSTIKYDLGAASDINALTKTVPLDTEKTAAAYKLTASGNAGNDASFDVTLIGNLYFKGAGLFSFFKSPEGSLEKLANGIALSRGFYDISRVRDVNNNEYLVPQPLGDKKPVRVGDQLLVKLKFIAQDDFEYLMLEDFLPSGFEVINATAFDGRIPYVQKERRDNRMVYYLSKIKKGEVYEIAYIIRAELPGEFMVKPARIECMYEPTIQGWSMPAKFTVEKK